MADRPTPAAASPVPRGRCRCGHLPTQHMVVRPVAGGGGFRLVPAGPCEICHESGCAAYAPGASPAAGGPA